jgi:glycosyltransferase involved in cell wall biosynthesis
MAARFRHLARSEWFHYLAMGGYAARDMRRLARFDGRLWQWGYFTDLPRPLPSVGERSGPLRVLWAGRMLSLKRVDTLVRAFATLRSQNDAATLTLIGEGPCRASIVRLVERLDLDGAVDLLASMPVEEVLQQMQQAHVYVLPSNAYEGWGAVVNESMSQGCAVIASHAAGSAKAIIQHGQNGMLFRPGDWRSLGRLLCELDEDESMRLRLAQAGQRAIAETWSPAIAAERLVAASSALLSGEPVPRYSGGPMAQER